GMKKFKPVGKVGIVLATLLLFLAPVTLISDLTQPLRFWFLFPHLNITSPITWGSFLLTLYPMNCIVYAFFMFKGDMRLTRVFAMIGIPLAISVHGYTGFILALGKARVLWNTALMPSYFLVSAMVSGIALMILTVIIRDRFFTREKKINKEIVFSLTGMLSITIVLDLFLAFSDVLVLLTSDTEARENAFLLLSGGFRNYFLGIEIFLGALIPLIIINMRWTRNNIPAVSIASVLIMIGILAMRYVMVVGGQTIPLS
ncbi:MAG: NrfD/PsrC family molybdoenzyme membrane anchor subunit, partial [Dehalococcoidia bacterium]|nr:NrfD/PsrC family molybdoenzyme membrane anchor subunit [Dehalococcoidia bacterium]